MQRDCASGANCTLDAALAWSRTEAARGLPLVVSLEAGMFNITSHVFDNRTLSSEVRITGDGTTTLVVDAALQPILTVNSSPATTISLRGLVFWSRVHLIGGSLNIESCRFEDISTPLDGGAVAVAAGSLSVRSSTFVDNRAPRGGAVAISGGEASFESCRFANNVAEQEGGGLHVSGGIVSLGKATLFEANTASSGTTAGNSLFVSNSGTLKYYMPAPPGRWVFSSALPYQQLLGATDADYPFACA